MQPRGTQAEGAFTILQLCHPEHLVPEDAAKEERKMEDISGFSLPRP